MRGLKRRLDEAKGNWREEFPHVLWAYHTTPNSTTEETHFRLTYGTEAVIPVEERELNWRTTHPFTLDENDGAISEELDFIDETRSFTAMIEAAIKKITANRYNKSVNPKEFDPRYLILRRADVGAKNTREGKLTAN